MNRLGERHAAPLITIFLAIVSLSLTACSDSGTGGGQGAAATGPLDSGAMQTQMGEALSEADRLDRVTRMVKLLERLDKNNLEGAIAAHEERLTSVERDEIGLFANAWARIDAPGALDRVLKWKNPGLIRKAIAEIVFLWTRSGGASEAREYAFKSLDRSEDETETTRNVVLDSVVRGLAAAGEHEQLTRTLEEFPSDRTRTWLITQGLLQFYRQSIPDVREYVDSIPWEAKNDLKRDALRTALLSMVKADAEAASGWLESIEGKLEKGAYLEDFAAAWAQNDPLAAIEWLQERPQSAGRSAALRASAFRYLTVNGPEAEEWIRARLDEPLIDTTMRFPLAQYLMSVDIQEALPVAEKIGKTNEKSNALKQILMMWSRTDYDAVRRYMEEVGVPDDVERTVVGQNEIRMKKRGAQAAKQG